MNKFNEKPKARPIDHISLEVHSAWAYESNLRMMSSLSGVAEGFLELAKMLETDHPGQKALDSIARDIILALCQANWSNRQLAGALNPCKSVPTCQKSKADSILAVTDALGKMLNDPD